MDEYNYGNKTSELKMFDTQELRDNLFELNGYPYLKSTEYSEEHRKLIGLEFRIKYDELLTLIDQAEALENGQ